MSEFTKTELYAISLAMDEWISRMKSVPGVDLEKAIGIAMDVKEKAERKLKEGV